MVKVLKQSAEKLFDRIQQWIHNTVILN